MTVEERAYNYASTQKPTKLQVGEIAKHYNNGYQQALKDFMEKACEWWENTLEYNPGTQYILKSFKNYMQDEM